MPRSRQQIRKGLRYSIEKEKWLMQRFGLQFRESPDDPDPIPLIIDNLIREANEWCTMEKYEWALIEYEDALSMLNHHPIKELPIEAIYLLRAKCSLKMKNFQKIIQDCTLVLNSDKDWNLPFTPECCQLKAIAHLQLGQKDLATATTERIPKHSQLPEAFLESMKRVQDECRDEG
ncbi:uncharacterized protein LOC118427124 [Branchiostoma floridae]|uniref:Uncharacterized protein LOC118427124 n=1 Tax=Branchiostoma floridae TaxID=7739 RepID=A0A9J7M1D5_BRAFL|nr:uncharacterized protein LOC118427124 [Branchiostoma floridae]